MNYKVKLRLIILCFSSCVPPRRDIHSLLLSGLLHLHCPLQAVAATLLFISGFSLGQGSVCWILLTEIVPSRIRAQAFSIFTAVNWLSNLFIGLFTLSAINAMGEWLLPSSEGGPSPSARDQQKVGVAGLYALFCVLSVLAVAFIYFFVRETMGKSLEELEEAGGGGSAGGGNADRLAFDVGGAREGLGDDGGSTNALLQLSEHGGADDEDGEGACRVMI